MAQKVRMSKDFELTGVVLYKNTGEGSTGDDWYMLKIGGFTFFVDRDMYKSVAEGDKVLLSGEYASDRYNKKTSSYSPQFELDGILVLSSADGSIAADELLRSVGSNGNGIPKVEKGQPS